MHNDIVVNIPTEASPAAEQFTGNIWPCLCIASYLGWVLNDCFLSILANYLHEMSITLSGVQKQVQKSPICSNIFPLRYEQHHKERKAATGSIVSLMSLFLWDQ